VQMTDHARWAQVHCLLPRLLDKTCWPALHSCYSGHCNRAVEPRSALQDDKQAAPWQRETGLLVGSVAIAAKMPSQDFYRGLVESLPPLETRDLHSLRNDLSKLPDFDQAVWDEAVQSKTCTGSKAASSPLADALKAAVEDHQKVYRDQGMTARFTIEPDEADLALRTFVEHLDPHNWGTACWWATWKITEADAVEVSGSVHTHVYYFEDQANVQKQASREFESTSMAAGSMEEVAKSIVDHVKASEKAFLADLADEDAVMTSLKQIRRILPITRTRMKW
jgi:F-actin capping protein alpha subunit